MDSFEFEIFAPEDHDPVETLKVRAMDLEAADQRCESYILGRYGRDYYYHLKGFTRADD